MSITRNWRKTLFRLHGWLGLNVGLLLFVVCFSGSFATLSHEIDWLIDPEIRVPYREAPYDWTAMYATLGREFPDGQVSGIYAPEGRGFAALAYVSIDGQTRKAFLDPYTGRLQGHTSFFNTQRFFRSFHRRFFDGGRGIIVVTLTAFVLLCSGISGFAYYKGWVRHLFSLERWRGPRRLWGDLHKTTGIWALVFSLFIASTGVFYFVEVLFQRADNYRALLPPPLPSIDRTTLGEYGPQPDLREPNEYAALARAARPDLEIRSCRMPVRPGEPVYFDGQSRNPFLRDRANKVLIHPFTGEVVGTQYGSDLGIISFITDCVDPVHFGYFGGLGTKIIWCVFGLVLSFSILGGTILWVVRSLPTRRASWWMRGAGVSTALTLGYFIVVVLTTVEGIHVYGKPADRTVVLGETAVGPYHVALSTTGRTDDGMAEITVAFPGGGLPNYKEVFLVGTGVEPVMARGTAVRQRASIEMAPGAELEIRLTAWDNRVHSVPFTVGTVPERIDGRRSWPNVRPGVWWVIALFSALTVGSIVAWVVLLIRVLRRARSGPESNFDPLEDAKPVATSAGQAAAGRSVAGLG